MLMHLELVLHPLGIETVNIVPFNVATILFVPCSSVPPTLTVHVPGVVKAPLKSKVNCPATTSPFVYVIVLLFTTTPVDCTALGLDNVIVSGVGVGCFSTFDVNGSYVS